MSDRARRAVEFAAAEATEFGDHAVGAIHLFLGLLREHEGLGGAVLEHVFGVSYESEHRVERFVRQANTYRAYPGPRGEFVPAEFVLERASQTARGMNAESVGTEHILLALISEPTDEVAGVLRTHKVSAEKVRDTIHRLLSEEQGRRSK